MDPAPTPRVPRHKRTPKPFSKRNRPKTPRRLVKRPTLADTAILCLSPDSDNPPFDHTFLDPFRKRNWRPFQSTADANKQSNAAIDESGIRKLDDDPTLDTPAAEIAVKERVQHGVTHVEEKITNLKKRPAEGIIDAKEKVMNNKKRSAVGVIKDPESVPGLLDNQSK